MCGLAGIFICPGERTEQEWAEIRDCFTQTLLFNEERGREASGVALVRSDSSLLLFKAPVPATELVEMDGYRRVVDALGPETTCLLGHTRMPTKGSRWNNANNHPVVAGHVVGIHNGHIKNDDQLFAALALPRQGEVDSEIIFRLLDTLSPAGDDGRYMAAVKNEMARLEGRFATMNVDLRRPDRLLVLKNEAPLCVHYHAPWQALCFSSRYLFLRKAFGRSVVTEALDSGYGYLFDAAGLPACGKEPLETLEIASKKW
ncbi:MAG: hypothetical protein JXA93_11710 [Anaerolineae bacterium]|nr:hypothetical protein [Anaerolineae bacterium]